LFSSACTSYRIHNTTEDVTAAQKSKAASIAAESEAEKDGGAVTERKHFPLNVNRAGYIVFSVSIVLLYLQHLQYFVWFRVTSLDFLAA